ncbi:hypothetical protein [Rubripirellula obstinata]|nr:hypothetical protein [Rubripirellula obstinata]
MLTDALFSPTTLLWLAGALIAFFLLIGSMSQRRISLTALLRRYVSKNQSDFKQPSSDAADKKRAPKNKTPPQ